MEVVPIESAYPGFGELVVSVIFIHQRIDHMGGKVITHLSLGWSLNSLIYAVLIVPSYFLIKSINVTRNH